MGQVNRLHPDDIDSIAEKVAENAEKAVKSFRIESETHYRDHIALREVVDSYKRAQGYFWKILMGLAVLGSVATTGIYAVYSILKIKSGTS
jgi:hypothetical protein